MFAMICGCLETFYFKPLGSEGNFAEREKKEESFNGGKCQQKMEHIELSMKDPTCATYRLSCNYDDWSLNRLMKMRSVDIYCNFVRERESYVLRARLHAYTSRAITLL